MKKIYLFTVAFFIVDCFFAHAASAKSRIDAFFISIAPSIDTTIQFCPGDGGFLNTYNNTAMIYQWQVNTGSGFANLTDDNNYAGTDVPTLQLFSAPSSWYGYQYRCLMDGVPSNTFVLKFVTQWLHVTDNWSNPANWSCGKVPDAAIDVLIGSGGDIVIVDQNAICRSLTVNPNVSIKVDPGVKLVIAH